MLNLTSSDTAFPVGSLVLVTGASGYIAMHITEQLLFAGYNVRGTVRDQKKAAWITKFYSERYGAGKFSAIIVPEMSAPGAFDEAVKSVQGVIHTASNVTFSPDPNEVIPSTVAGVTSLLYSTTKEPSVKSFVYTSSTLAASGSNTPLNLDTGTWNDADIEEAWSATMAPFPLAHSSTVYNASKAEAEKSFWEFVKDDKCHFRANSVLPDTTIGEVLSTQGSSSTGGWIRMVFEKRIDFVKQLPPGRYVNVKDVARLHVAALLSESVENERIFASAGLFTWNQILATLRKLYPFKQFSDDIEGEQLSFTTVSNERGEQLLQEVYGREGWTSLEETVADNVMGLA